MAKKQHINLAIIGHVDHGKSTAIGHLLTNVGAVPERKLEEYRNEAKDIGRESWMYAWVLDKLKEERKRGLTVDLGYYEFETDKYHFTIVDAPGHRDFIKNMITGTSQADAAILVVSAKENEFEAGFSRGGQTREHSILAQTLGIEDIIVCINKMDAEVVNYSQEQFEDVKSALEGFLGKQLGFDLEQMPFIPISGLEGDNLTESSENMPWYDGPTLVEALDEYVEPPPELTDKPFRLPIQKVYKVKGVGTVAAGRVASGVLKPGDKIKFYPGGQKSVAHTIEMHHEELDEATPGDNVGINVKGISQDEIHRGDVMAHPDSPPPVTGGNKGTFIGRVRIVSHPSSVFPGYSPVLHSHTLQVSCEFQDLLKKYDSATGELLENNPKFIKQGDGALVRFRPKEPCVLQNYEELSPLGRFAFRDMGELVGVGVVQKIEEEE